MIYMYTLYFFVGGTFLWEHTSLILFSITPRPHPRSGNRGDFGVVGTVGTVRFAMVFEGFFGKMISGLLIGALRGYVSTRIFFQKILFSQLRLTCQTSNASFESQQRYCIGIHLPKQTWNLKMDPWKRGFLLETIHHFQVRC